MLLLLFFKIIFVFHGLLLVITCTILRNSSKDFPACIWKRRREKRYKIFPKRQTRSLKLLGTRIPWFLIVRCPATLWEFSVVHFTAEQSWSFRISLQALEREKEGHWVQMLLLLQKKQHLHGTWRSFTNREEYTFLSYIFLSYIFLSYIFFSFCGEPPPGGSHRSASSQSWLHVL